MKLNETRPDEEEGKIAVDTTDNTIGRHQAGEKKCLCHLDNGCDGFGVAMKMPFFSFFKNNNGTKSIKRSELAEKK